MPTITRSLSESLQRALLTRRWPNSWIAISPMAASAACGCRLRLCSEGRQILPFACELPRSDASVFFRLVLGPYLDLTHGPPISPSPRGANGTRHLGTSEEYREKCRRRSSPRT